MFTINLYLKWLQRRDIVILYAKFKYILNNYDLMVLTVLST